MMKKMMAAILLALVTFFSYGCTVAQRKEILQECLEASKEYAVNEIIPKAKNAALDYMEKKATAEIEKQLKIQDELLTRVAEKDPETGLEIKKTWRDFDSDKDGQLSAQELAVLTAYIIKKSAGKPGGMDTAKAAAGSAAIIGVAMLGLYGVKKIRPATPTPKTPEGGSV